MNQRIQLRNTVPICHLFEHGDHLFFFSFQSFEALIMIDSQRWCSSTSLFVSFSVPISVIPLPQLRGQNLCKFFCSSWRLTLMLTSFSKLLFFFCFWRNLYALAFEWKKWKKDERRKKKKTSKWFVLESEISNTKFKNKLLCYIVLLFSFTVNTETKLN